MIGDVAALHKMVWFCISAIFRYYLEAFQWKTPSFLPPNRVKL